MSVSHMENIPVFPIPVGSLGIVSNCNIIYNKNEPSLQMPQAVDCGFLDEPSSQPWEKGVQKLLMYSAASSAAA